MMIECEYVFHDGFILRRDGEWAVVFDYWKDPLGAERIETLVRSGVPVYVVVSHHHKDHFVPAIFDWCALPCADVHYVISADVFKFCRHRLNPNTLYQGVRVPEQRITVIRPGDTVQLGGLTVEAFGSTDLGNSYVITERSSGFTAMHAGDLNDWLWLDESTPEEVADMEGRFRKILRDISGAHPRLDLALFPVDSRIGRRYWSGAAQLLEAIDVKMFVPMHFGLGDTPEESARLVGDALRFAEYVPPSSRALCCGLTATGDRIALNY
ncbi:MAG: hypothetical protein K2O24_07810 [Muribaculaceae bacterium]|nr:hypothetical protein [Muribaculaceae bacterium]